jgi:hypothetical protein
LTQRESDELDALMDEIAPHATRSVMLRWVVCQVLEKHRNASKTPRPFVVDLARLDPRSKRNWRPVGRACAPSGRQFA